ncbi:uncharacterized protein LOC130939561 [Arachis stenosperma]|uniref:uncharacterized protein LOC130939561 n=1 Tax=Arachis stenosperma TaxID=217475 RepID=UPI0025ACD621|nr:uncharacterized protein LOC130939561 [Arachis stenosperma]
MGLVHGHQGHLEQLEQELERQREAERNLREEIEQRKELEEKLLKLESSLRSQNSRGDREESPLGGEDTFSEDIMRTKVPRNFKSPDMNLYDGTTDPKHHLSNFKSRMYLADASDVTRCCRPLDPSKTKRGKAAECEYHKMYGHSTNDYYDLKNVIERLAREGRLDRYLMERSDNHRKRKRDDEDRRDPPPQTPERHIHMISGGFAGGRLIKSSRKKHLKRVYQVKNESPDLPTISFTKQDGQGIMSEHDDPVVITMILANANLHRTLDQGSSVDILFKPAFDKLGLDKMKLKAYPDTLYGLGDMPVKPLGYIPLHMTFGKGENSKTLSIDFIVIDVGLTYNSLIGRTMLNRLGAVVSIPHLCMKFPTPKGIAMVRGDQKLAKKCYNESLNLRGKSKKVHTIELGGIKAKEELRP